MSAGSAIPAYLKSLRLPGMAQSYAKLADHARTHQLSYEAYLEALLQEEIAQRRTNRIRALIKAARFPVMKTLDAFEFAELPSLPRQQVLEPGAHPADERRQLPLQAQPAPQGGIPPNRPMSTAGWLDGACVNRL